jgi:mRNA-degrading endonuclease RelE of RelBE toxin-antitoxin system
MVTIQIANQIVEEELRKIERQGYSTTRIRSQTTNSSYYEIREGQYRVAFRISDHQPTKSHIITLDVSYRKTRVDDVRRFVTNRLNALKCVRFNYTIPDMADKEIK